MSKEPTYRDVLIAARSKVVDGESRFANEPFPFRAIWWPDSPTIEQELLSDHAVESAEPELSDEFFEEVTAIRDSLKELGYKGELAAWQRSGREAGEQMWEGLNLHADALGLWDQLCLPLRRRGDEIFRILSPRDAGGTPIVQSLSLDEYIRDVSAYTARATIEIAGLKKSREKWQVVAAVFALMVFIVLIV